MTKKMKRMINEAKRLVDILLDEAEQNEIPEVPDDSKNSGKDVKKEIEGKPTGDSSAVLSKGEPVKEHEDNLMPEVPDESKTAGKDIKKAISDAINQKVEQPIKVQQPKVNNELPDGTTPDSVKTSVDKMKTDIVEDIRNILNKKKVIRESDELTLDDINDYLEDLKKKGFTDKEKLQGMLDRAKEIAKKQNKGNDKKVVFGIFQSFFKDK
jgi:hypothetical protein